MTVAVLLITPVVFMRESKNGLFVVFRRRYTGIVPDDGLEKGPLKDFFFFFCNQQNPTLWVVIRDVSNMRALSHSG